MSGLCQPVSPESKVSLWLGLHFRFFVGNSPLSLVHFMRFREKINLFIFPVFIVLLALIKLYICLGSGIAGVLSTFRENFPSSMFQNGEIWLWLTGCLASLVLSTMLQMYPFFAETSCFGSLWLQRSVSNRKEPLYVGMKHECVCIINRGKREKMTGRDFITPRLSLHSPAWLVTLYWIYFSLECFATFREIFS